MKSCVTLNRWGTILRLVLWLLIIAAYLDTDDNRVRPPRACKAQVLIVNLFLGWTMIGWVVALVMAFRAVPRATDVRPG